ncbi:MAG: hypothetical protein M3410_13370 [Acidobacteriota bacterium]|nr:hypothetical protein [Acidobacteriota bacterium]
MTTYHPDLAAGRWFTFSLAAQLGNVGSEYERALRWKERGDEARFEHAFARLLELVDLTIADPRWKNHRLKELTRLREVICDQLCNETREIDSPSDLREYFLYFGILARSERDKAVDAVGVVSK